MIIRSYVSADCEEIAELFYQTVHAVNAKDYTDEQLNAWASGRVNLAEWDKSFLEHITVVAVENDVIVGFGDIDKSGILTGCMYIKIFKVRELPQRFAISWSAVLVPKKYLRMRPLRQKDFLSIEDIRWLGNSRLSEMGFI